MRDVLAGIIILVLWLMLFYPKNVGKITYTWESSFAKGYEEIKNRKD